jgi:hypothetical protein
MPLFDGETGAVDGCRLGQRLRATLAIMVQAQTSTRSSSVSDAVTRRTGCQRHMKTFGVAFHALSALVNAVVHAGKPPAVSGLT